MRSAFPLVVLAILLTVPLNGRAGLDPHLSAALNIQPPDAMLPVLVRLAPPDLRVGRAANLPERRRALLQGLRRHAARTQAPLRAWLAARGARVTGLWHINALATQLSPADVARVARRPDVVAIALDRVVRAHRLLAGGEQSRDEPLNAEWNLALMGAPELWAEGVTGEGTVVAGLDSGVDVLHPDLADRWRGGTNSWFDAHDEWDLPHDSDGHGTATMALVVGGAKGGTTIGAAPGAQWIAARLFDAAGEAKLSQVHAAFQWVLDPDGDPTTDDAPDVVNSSWGFRDEVDSCVEEFRPDVQALRAAGIVVVFAAGNEGPGQATSISPANYPESFAVGAVAPDMTVLPGSSRGPSACDGAVFPDLVAPGMEVWTADLTFNGIFPESYAVAEGTSFAAPQVAGLFLLLRQAFPGRSVGDLQASLRQTAQDTGASGPDDDSGFGVPDVKAALAWLQETSSEMPPFVGEALSGCGDDADCPQGLCVRRRCVHLPAGRPLRTIHRPASNPTIDLGGAK